MVISNEKEIKKCVDNDVSIGHLKKKCDPRNIDNILMEISGVHIIDPNATIEKLRIACEQLKNIVASNGKVLFVCTKKIAKSYIKEVASSLDMPYITEKWFGGLITNFFVVKKMIKKNEDLNSIINSSEYKFLSKKEQTVLKRVTNRQSVLLDGITKKIYRTPGAMIVVDIKNERIAIKEASRSGIPVFGLVDTNVYSPDVTYPIPCNDDKLCSIRFIIEHLKLAILDGLAQLDKSKTSSSTDNSSVK